MSENDELEIPQNFSKVILGLAIGALVLGGVIYAAYNYTKKGSTVLPSGFPTTQEPTTPFPSLSNTDCSKMTAADPRNVWPFYIKCQPFKADASVKWKTIVRPEGFSFDVPETLKLESYGNGMGYAYNEIPATSNLLLSVDLASSRSGEFKTMGLDTYPKEYWRQFSGLTSLKDSFSFTNSKNENGVRASYVNVSNETPGVEVFFEFPERKGDFVHFGSGVLSNEVFNTLLDSFKFTK